MTHDRVLLGPVATWFPDTVAEVATLAELSELPAHRRDHALALGIDTVRTADAMTEVDLAAEAARIALTRPRLDAADLDALILVTGRAPHYLLASEATRLQHRLGATRAFTTAVGDLGCVSISSALTLAAALVRAETHCRTAPRGHRGQDTHPQPLSRPHDAARRRCGGGAGHHLRSGSLGVRRPDRAQ